MNVKQLAQFIQMKMHDDLVVDAEEESVRNLPAAQAQARANARALAAVSGADPDEAAAAAAAAVEVKPRNVDPEIPTLEWCGRIAKKHARAAHQKVGKLQGLREELLERVKLDPDTTGKMKP